MGKRASAEVRATAGVLQLVAAHRHDAAVEFHPRLTVLVGSDPELANWVTSLLGARSPCLLRVDALESLAGCSPTAAAGEPQKSSARVSKELDRWERVRRQAENRLVHAQERARRVDPRDVGEAARLRSEWQLDRRAARREEYELFLARFGVRSCAELSAAGTGFGDTSGDVAIREAATVVSMAERRCARLRRAAATPRLHDIDADAVDRLFGHALARHEYVRSIGPIVVDRVLDALNPVARRRACERLLSRSSVRQVVIVTSCADIARWAARCRATDVLLAEVGGTKPADHVTT